MITATSAVQAASNEYHFVTTWRLAATAEEVYEILGDPLRLVDWWPEVYLQVTELSPANEDGLGRQIFLHTKGWLPYTLKWQFVVTEANFPTGFRLQATGDFEGTGEWTFTQEGDDVVVQYDWRIRAEKPFIKHFSFLLKPIFSWNHRWAMEKGEAGLRKEIARRREMKLHADRILISY